MKEDLTLERLEELMKEHHDTKASLAKKLGLSVTTTYRWFNGRADSIKNTTLMQIADLYNVSVGWLFGLNMPKEKESEEHSSLRKRIEAKLFKVSIDDLRKVEAMIDIFLKE